MSKLSVIAIKERARIAEHAFRAGFAAGHAHGLGTTLPINEHSRAADKAWNAYEPEEDRR